MLVMEDDPSGMVGKMERGSRLMGKIITNEMGELMLEDGTCEVKYQVSK